MGEIRKRLGNIADYFDNERLTVRCQLEYVGEAIETEIKKLHGINKVGRHEERIRILEDDLPSYNFFNKSQLLADRIDILEKLKVIGEIAGVGQIEARIKALESYLKVIDKPAKRKDDPLPYDRHGKPPGGLKKGDVLLVEGWCKRFIDLGIFHRFSKPNKIWGSWKTILRDGKPVIRDWTDGDSFYEKNEVTFLFRPKDSEPCPS